MYSVNGKTFKSFFKSIEAAKKIDGEVFEVLANGELGLSRWHPPKKVSEAKMRMYRERKAAYEAHLRMMASD